jgi:hypothetical protein
MQEAIHPQQIGRGRGLSQRLAKNGDLELTAQNARLLGIKFLIQTKLGSQIEKYSTPRDALVGKKWEQ